MATIFTPEETASPEAVKRRRAYADALMKQGTDASPVKHWTQALARVLQGGMGGYFAGKAEREEKENQAADSAIRTKLLADVLGGNTAATAAPTAAAPSMAGEGTSRTMAMPNVAPEVKDGIVQTANALGISPVDLATTISYETAGTFDPTKAGPRTQWGQHRGLIQFGEPQAEKFGVDWNNPVASQLGPNGAVAAYLKNAGVKPGMGLMDIYSAINAGGVGRYGASDANNGGAPGTVADKVNNQMAGHRAKAQRLFADLPAPGASPVSMESGQPGFAVPPGPQGMTGATFDAITNGQPLDPVFTTEGIAQPWMGSALQPDQPAAPQVAQTPLPPPRPNDLADIPAQGAVPAIGELPPQTPAALDLNSNDAGSRTFAVTNGGTQQPQAGGASWSSLLSALGGGSPANPAPAQAPAALAPAAAPAPSAGSGNISNAALIDALTNPRASAATQQLAASILSTRIKPRDQWVEQKLADGTLVQRNSQTGEMKVVRPGVDPMDRESKQLDIETKRKNLGKSDSPTVQRIKQPDGSEVAVQWDQEKKAWVPLEAPQGGNAVRAPTKLTEQQSKDLTYFNRGVQALEAFEKGADAYANGLERGASQLPGGNYLNSESFQKAKQAGRNFLASILRKDSGAAITENEEKIYGDVFLPQPGDKPGMLAQKREARRQAIEAIKGGLGTAEVLARGSEILKAPPAAKSPTGKTKSGVSWSVE